MPEKKTATWAVWIVCLKLSTARFTRLGTDGVDKLQ